MLYQYNATLPKIIQALFAEWWQVVSEQVTDVPIPVPSETTLSFEKSDPLLDTFMQVCDVVPESLKPAATSAKKMIIGAIEKAKELCHGKASVLIDDKLKGLEGNFVSSKPNFKELIDDDMGDLPVVLPFHVSVTLLHDKVCSEKVILALMQFAKLLSMVDSPLLLDSHTLVQFWKGHEAARDLMLVVRINDVQVLWCKCAVQWSKSVASLPLASDMVLEAYKKKGGLPLVDESIVDLLCELRKKGE